MQAKITITPEKSLFVEPVRIIIENLPMNTAVKIKAILKDENEKPWFLSEAIFETNNDGVIDLSKQAPISGSYGGIDSMGLFYSMLPVDKTEKFYSVNGIETRVFLCVELEKEIIAEKTIERCFSFSNIEIREIREDGVVGVFCYPKNSHQIPGIITVSGSGGGISTEMAQMLASQGYAVLALGYFGVEGLPEKLENIHFEYFQNAIKWFKSQKQVDENKIALRGASYGGELVLLLAATFPQEISAVVAISPPSMIFGGFPYSNKPKWIYKNSPIRPFIGGFSNDDINLTEAEDLLKTTQNGAIAFHAGTFEDPYVVTPLFLKRIEKNKSLLDVLAIQVEKIQCPLLIITGEDDQVHPATMHGNLIMDRLEKYNSTIDRKHIHYSNAGHSLRTPYEPKIDLPWFVANNVFCYSGGTIEGNYRASVDGWKEMINFLHRVFNESF